MVRRENSPGAISDNSGTIAQGGTATLHDRLGVYMALLAVVIAAIALGYEISQSSSRVETRELQAQVMDAKIQAGAARAETVANEARVNARIAVDEMERMRTALAAKGILIPKPEH
jgi:hypothetical protein